MKRLVCLGLAIVTCAAGCTSPPQTEPPVENITVAPPAERSSPASQPANLEMSQILARINGQPITMREVVEPLLASRGLALLLNVAQLDMAKQDSRDAHVTVRPQDIQHEQELTLEKMFKDADQKEQDQLTDAELKHQTDKAGKLRQQIRKDREQFLNQYLQNKNFSREEYDIVVELNAYLRKAAQVQLHGKITDAMVEKEFGLEYGETAQVRVIQLANMQEVQEAQRRLREGQDFAQVAKEMSRNPLTAPTGGQMQPFSLQTQGVPQEFRQLAFSLQPGQVSDPLLLRDTYYLIKLEKRIPPRAVKFADVKESLRQSMFDKFTDDVMNQLRENLGTQVMQKLTIDDAVMAKQFNDLKAKREGAIRDRQKLNEQWKKEREASTRPSTEPIAK